MNAKGQTVLVTGATGSVGSNVCRLASAAGYDVKGLVRPGSDMEPLTSMGATAVIGDVTDPASLKRAAQEAHSVIHCAAQIGGTWSDATPEDFFRVNLRGSINVLDAAEEAGARNVVMLLSAIILHSAETRTEESRIAPIRPGDSPYTASKRGAYYEAMARACRGSHISFVVPGAIYGPTPYVDRALVPTIFTGTLMMAARGELRRYLPMPLPWVTAENVAAVSLAAMERGRSGARYLALGRADDVCSLPAFCNRFLEMAAIEHRVEEVTAESAGGDGEFGPMVKLLHDRYPEPYLDCSVTTAALGVEPISLTEGLAETLSWLREQGRLPFATAETRSK